MTCLLFGQYWTRLRRLTQRSWSTIFPRIYNNKKRDRPLQRVNTGVTLQHLHRQPACRLSPTRYSYISTGSTWKEGVLCQTTCVVHHKIQETDVPKIQKHSFPICPKEEKKNEKKSTQFNFFGDIKCLDLTKIQTHSKPFSKKNTLFIKHQFGHTVVDKVIFDIWKFKGIFKISESKINRALKFEMLLKSRSPNPVETTMKRRVWDSQRFWGSTRGKTVIYGTGLVGLRFRLDADTQGQFIRTGLLHGS